MGVCKAKHPVRSISRRGKAKYTKLILKLQLDSRKGVGPRRGTKPRDCKRGESRTRTRRWNVGQGPAGGGGRGVQNFRAAARTRGRAKEVKKDAPDSGAPAGSKNWPLSRTQSQERQCTER